MARVSLSNAWDDARAIFVRDGRLLVAVALALIFLPMATVGLIVPSDPAEAETHHSLLQLAAALIGLVGQLALIRLAIGPATTVGAAISHGGRRFPAMLGAMIVLMLVFVLILLPIMAIMAATGAVDLANPARPTGAGAAAILLLAVAAIALTARFMITAAVASAESAGPVAILKRSWSLTRGNYWRLLGLLVLLLIVAIVVMGASTSIGGVLGAIISPDLKPFSVGALIQALFAAVGQGIFTVLSAVMVARVYLQLASRAEPEVTVPHSGT